MVLDDGSRIGVIGGGPAGSMFAYFLLTIAERVDMQLHVDIYEPRDFTQPAPGGCNMCGGIVSESLIQYLATEGINLPAEVVQRGIDSYILRTDDATVRIDTPLNEKRIAAVHRGGGPRDIGEQRWGSLDNYLLGLARELGAVVLNERVGQVSREDGKPCVIRKEETRSYDLLVIATGINSPGWKLVEQLGLEFRAPEKTKTYITELYLGEEKVTEIFGSSMNLFLTEIPRMDFAAIIPKGDYATVVLLGEDIDREMTDGFFNCAAVRNCFPPGIEPAEGKCHCSPWINIREASPPFADRVVLIGDSGATRLYKDGIGAAYRTAKAAALTAVFEGVSTEAFERYYMPRYRAITRDNRFGALLFSFIHYIHKIKPATRGTLRMAAREQARPGSRRRMSIIMWDLFTGSGHYRDIFIRSLDPRFWGAFLWNSLLSIPNRRITEGGKS